MAQMRLLPGEEMSNDMLEFHAYGPGGHSAKKVTELKSCPRCNCTDLETSPYPADRKVTWAIVCGNCHLYATCTDKYLLVQMWQSLVRAEPYG